MVLWLVSPFHSKAKKMVNGRVDWRSKLIRDIQQHQNPVMWIHCASLGEFEQGRPIIESFKAAYPEYRVLLTFFSPSGFEVQKGYSEADAVHYLPLDTKANVKDFYHIVKPSIGFVIKYEFWYHLMVEGRNQGIPILVCSAIFNSNQIFFKTYGNIFRKILESLEHIFVQDMESFNLLQKINIDSVTVAGDTRMDRVAAITRKAERNEIVESFLADHKAFIVGSSWPQDISVLAPLINKEKEMKFIIAPHEINEHHLSQIAKLITRPTAYYSKFDGTSDAMVLVVDTIGILSHLYRYGAYAYIGGAFGTGLHNVLEAATFGLPLFFGNKNYLKFREAVSLVKLNGAFAVGSSTDLFEAYDRLKQDDNLYQKTSKACLDYVKQHTGATDIIMEFVKTLIKT